MIRAYRLADGQYRLDFGDPPEKYPASEAFHRLEKIKILGGRWENQSRTHLTVPELALAEIPAEKVFGVVTGPSSCGCEPTMFRWVGEKEVEAGRTEPKVCRDCSKVANDRARISRVFFFAPLVIYHQCVIIDVCGEADVAEAVFEAEFAGHIR